MKNHVQNCRPTILSKPAQPATDMTRINQNARQKYANISCLEKTGAAMLHLMSPGHNHLGDVEMPTVYVSANFSLKVDLSDVEEDDYILTEWNNTELAKERAEYGRSNLHFSLDYRNPADDSLLIIMPTIDELYSGAFTLKRQGRIFFFDCDAKFKSNVHKLVKAAVDGGASFRIDSIAVNGAAFPIQASLDEKVIVSSKKL